MACTADCIWRLQLVCAGMSYGHKADGTSSAAVLKLSILKSIGAVKDIMLFACSFNARATITPHQQTNAKVVACSSTPLTGHVH